MMGLQGRSLLRVLMFTLLIRWSCFQQGQHCDTGRTMLEMDLPPSDQLLCPKLIPPSSERLSDISTTYSIQPAEQMCMDQNITYKHTIPNSGAHRPVAAQSGEYMYCPPQRWINNLQDGAVVLLVHPCVSKGARRSLAVMARSCLPEFILTAHPQLSQHRPFALVSWGRTLEMSHLTKAAVCDWLAPAFFNFTQMTEDRKPKYSLYLKKAAPLKRAPFTSGKSVAACCLHALSTYKLTELKGRKIRAALLSTNVEVVRNGTVKLPESQPHNNSVFKTQNITAHKALPFAGQVILTLNNDSNSKVNNGEKAETGNRTTAEIRPSPQPQGSSRSEKQRDNMSRTSDAHSVMTSQEEYHKHVGRPRVKTAAVKPGPGKSCEALGRCEPPRVLTTASSVQLRGRTMSDGRNDEAMWAAAALGFLLGLLAISVLHTRLYRHWRKPATLYWRECQQDYDSVADIIRRRLKMGGRRKKRASHVRRQECPLLPDSSTDNDSV